MSHQHGFSTAIGVRARRLLALPLVLTSVALAAGQEAKTQPQYKLRFHVQALEIPAKDFESFTDGWQIASAINSNVAVSQGRARAGVYPASYTSSPRDYQIKTSTELKASQVERFLERYEAACEDRVVPSGGRTEILFGDAKDFTLAYEPELNKDEQPTGEMKPKTATFQAGLNLKLDGQLVNDGTKMRLGIGYQFRALRRVDTFTFETNEGEFTVQQPSTVNSGLETSCIMKSGDTFALCGGPATRRVNSRKSLPVLGKLPYLGRLFNRSSRSEEDYYVLFLIRYQPDDI